MLRVLSCCFMLIVGCAREQTESPEVQANAQETKPAVRTTAVFEYGNLDQDGFDFVTKVDSRGLSVWLPQQFERPYLVLQQVPSASGVKYEKEGVVVWVKGREALLEVDGRSYKNCVENVRKSIWEDAKLRGVDYRAVGNEPGWHLEITKDKHILLVYDYGQQTIWTPTPEPEVDNNIGQAIYHAKTEAHDLKVRILGKPCQDSMSGEAFEGTVTVVLDGKTFHGCGRALH